MSYKEQILKCKNTIDLQDIVDAMSEDVKEQFGINCDPLNCETYLEISYKLAAVSKEFSAWFALADKIWFEIEDKVVTDV